MATAAPETQELQRILDVLTDEWFRREFPLKFPLTHKYSQFMRAYLNEFLPDNGKAPDVSEGLSRAG